MSSETAAPQSPPYAEVASPALECRALFVSHGRNSVLIDVNLTVDTGQTLALLGPSGSGKTTLLHTVAGFLHPDAGEVLLDGRIVASPRASVPPESRSAAMVFQNYALWPHLSALDNVAYPFRRSGLRKKAAREAAFALLDRLGAAALADRRPAELSGGQQQRVGVARALARRSRVTLLDEPTAHLDQALRAQVQEEIARVIRASGGAVVYATHDAGEALAIADRVALLRSGRLLQVGTPREIYENPCDLWAARLTGPAAAIRGPDRDAPWLVVRPEWTSLGGDLDGRVYDVRYRGAHTDYSLDTGLGRVVVRDDRPPMLAIGEQTSWSIRRSWALSKISDDDGA